MVIVAAVDRSPRAQVVISESARLAQAFGDPVHVVHVMSESEFIDLQQDSYDTTGIAVEASEVRRQAKAIAEKVLRESKIDGEAIGLFGRPAQRVIDHATDTNARFIVVSSRRRSPIGKVLFGSVAQAILLEAECPVVSVFPSNSSP